MTGTTSLVPLMSEGERQLLRTSLMECRGGAYFEFGCGRSTAYACQFLSLSSTIDSLESTIEWIRKVQGVPIVKRVLDQQRLHFYHIDINADPLNWGFPKDQSKRTKWPSIHR